MIDNSMDDHFEVFILNIPDLVSLTRERANNLRRDYSPDEARFAVSHWFELLYHGHSVYKETVKVPVFYPKFTDGKRLHHAYYIDIRKHVMRVVYNYEKLAFLKEVHSVCRDEWLWDENETARYLADIAEKSFKELASKVRNLFIDTFYSKAEREHYLKFLADTRRRIDAEHGKDRESVVDLDLTPIRETV